MTACDSNPMPNQALSSGMLAISGVEYMTAIQGSKTAPSARHQPMTTPHAMPIVMLRAKPRACG